MFQHVCKLKKFIEFNILFDGFIVGSLLLSNYFMIKITIFEMKICS